MLLWNAAVTDANIVSARVGTDASVRPAGRCPAARSSILSRIPVQVALLILLFAAPTARGADCIPIHQAGQHIGETRCVTGKVFGVKVGTKGVHFLDFCEDAMACPFTVVVFSNDLKDVGDVRRLAGRTIEIRGALKAYDGRPEIILSRISQIEGGATIIPPLPKNYDVENRGHFSAGRLHPTKKPRKAKAKPSTSVTFGNDVEGDDGR
jgi:hypothetical protein